MSVPNAVFILYFFASAKVLSVPANTSNETRFYPYHLWTFLRQWASEATVAAVMTPNDDRSKTPKDGWRDLEPIRLGTEKAMADIFISYAREDRETAKMLAQALAGQRWSVWWDQHIPSGRRFDDFIAKQLQAARCVIVLWSTAAVRSEWVIEEAAEARERNVLTPALIDTVKPPLGFRHRQAVDLIGWQGDQNHPGFARLIEDITAVLGEPPAQVSQQEEAGGAAGEKSSRIAVRANPFRLRPSFNNGLYGGLIGGALSGLFIGVTYYAEFTELDKSITLAIMPPIFLYGSFSGLLLGAFIQLFILWFCYLVTEKQYSSLAFNEVTGGLLGGAIGGIPVGALAGLIFGFSHPFFVGHVELVIGSLFIAIFIAFGARFSEYRGLWQNIARAFIAALLITACTATAGILILQLLNIDAWFFFGTTSTLMTQGGAILGVMIGMVSGLQVGLTLSLYRLWEV